MPDPKSGIKPQRPGAGPSNTESAPAPGRLVFIVLWIAFLGLYALSQVAHCDDWKVEAQGTVTAQTTLSGGNEADRGKFRPGLRAEIEAPLVLGINSPRAPIVAVVRLSLQDLASPPVNGAAGGVNTPPGARPAALAALAFEAQLGRAVLTGTGSEDDTRPRQRVSTRLGVELGYSSFLPSDASTGNSGAGTWAAAIIRLREERDGFEIRAGAGVGQLGRSQWGRVGVFGVSIPIRKAGSWLVVGADATLSGVTTLQLWTGIRVQ